MIDPGRAAHDNMIDAFDSLSALQPDGLVERRDGVATLASGLPMRLFNQVVIESNEATPAALGRAVAVMRARRVPFYVTLRVGRDERFRSVAEGLGLVLDPEETFPGMAILPIPPAEPVPEGLEIRRLTIVERADHATVVERVFGIDRAIVDAIVSEAAFADPRFAFYAGYARGVPVVSGLGIATAETIGVYNIATVAEARRRGYGAAITRQILVDGARRGCRVGALQASSMGRAVYEAIGFRTVFTYIAYVDPTRHDAHADA